jgi:hypothetical protein
MSLAPPEIKASDADVYKSRPMVDGRKVFIDGKVTPWDGEVQEVYAPIYEVREASRADAAGCERVFRP